jgi:hypothetical protein
MAKLIDWSKWFVNNFPPFIVPTSCVWVLAWEIISQPSWMENLLLEAEILVMDGTILSKNYSFANVSKMACKIYFGWMQPSNRMNLGLNFGFWINVFKFLS